MKRAISFLSPKAPLVLTYMLQQFEYNPGKFLEWIASYPNLFKVQKRGKLHFTSRAKLMVAAAYLSWGFVLIAGVMAAYLQTKPLLLLILLAPAASALSLLLITLVLQAVIVNPRQNREIHAAKAKLAKSSAQRIAVMGSYGKTTMKELLVTVLSEAKKVAATPGNKNVLISQARWVNQNVQGDEDILIFEYGEAGPGDIAKLAGFSAPSMAVVTGLAPAHMDAYPSLEAVADDFAAIQGVVSPENTFVSGGNELLRQKIKGNYYDENGLGDREVTNANVDFSGTSFTLTNGDKTLQLKTGLLGKHQIGPITAAVVIALRLGLTNEQITAGVAATQPYEHRMQPRHLHGAWIIDDTYNGNIEGMRAGLELLKSLPGKRKIYVTPGLVDQGNETERVHAELGALIAAARPDQVVLMQNSATSFMQAGLQKGGFKGEIKVEVNPLEFYTNLDHYLAAGDVVMLQNDWPDSYA